ncbi:MAG: aminotransferase class I/II-fold pyridoxal phosphate-dependent enzyme [Oscillospiraceae bacterium]|nr:aminotransferase class I/II-fold pyridoxal phosphate-dependent enzyme [Oscillospiraceae bacterium]
MAAPLYERLKNYARKNRISFSMPGHKSGRGLRNDLISLDVTELEETENLHHGGKYVKEAQRLLSRLYGSNKSYILTGGSTAAIQAMICGSVKPGGLLLAASDCHQSVINTCALLGIRIRFFPKEIDSEFKVPKYTAAIKEYITDDTDAVIITSPNYYGVCSDIEKIAAECHERNIPLLVDEAHGAHFIADSRFPETAVKYADAVCHSAHKTLNAMNGAAYLHLNGSLINTQRTEKALSMFQSSSPSYVIAASADTARDELASGNEWNRTYNLCKDLRSKLIQAGIKVLENDDMTRLVLNFTTFGITGFEASRILSQNGIDIEMADLFNIVLIITPSNTLNDLEALFKTVTQITAANTKTTSFPRVPIPPLCNETLSPGKAFFSARTEISLADADGRVSCVSVTPYPPGIPVIRMGETIKKEQIEYINYILLSGGEVTGLSDGKITVAE